MLHSSAMLGPSQTGHNIFLSIYPQAACRAIAALGAASQLTHVLLRPAQPGCCRRGRALRLPPLLRPSPRKQLLGVELEGAGGIPGGAPASEQAAALEELNDAAAQAAAVQPTMQPAVTAEAASVQSLP